MKKPEFVLSLLIVIACLVASRFVLAGSSANYEAGLRDSGLATAIFFGFFGALSWLLALIGASLILARKRGGAILLILAIIAGEVLPTTYFYFIPWIGYILPGISTITLTVVNIAVVMGIWLSLRKKSLREPT